VLGVSVLAALAFALLYTAAPVAVWVFAIGAAVFVAARRELSDADRRALTLLVAGAVLVRLLFIAIVFFANVPNHHDQWTGELTGDGAYGVERGLRARDLLLGFPTNKLDAFVVNDTYGANSYNDMLIGVQVLFGPIPYSVRLLNGLFFLACALVMFRLSRRSFGRLPALIAVFVVLFLPSFFIWSVSLLKESLYFAASAVFLTAGAASLRAGNLRRRLLTAVLALGALVVMEGVRHKTMAIGLVGWAGAAAALALWARPRRYLPVAAAAVITLAAFLSRPGVQARLLDGIADVAKIHAGHVFTLGHGYKLLDEDFYVRQQAAVTSTLTLTPGQAARFVLRGIASFCLTPLPWQLTAVRELVYVPEQLVWYVMLALLPFGVAAGWRRDPAATAMIIGYVVPTSLVLALTNGNIGTLVRLRGIVTVILVWPSALGFCVVLERILARAARPRATWHAVEPEPAS